MLGSRILGPEWPRICRAHAGDLGILGSTILNRSMARWGDILVAGCWSPAGWCHPVHAVRDPAHR